ncbi:15815_t:CDS:2, partial [Gigaspora margarita]
MSSLNSELQSFKDSINKLIKAESDENKATILFEIYAKLVKLKGVDDIPKTKTLNRKDQPKLPDITNYPTTVEEIKTIVKNAYQDGNTIVRVIGSGHSIPNAIIDTPPDGKKVVFISLEKFYGVEIDKTNNTAKVKSGTHLNKDPQDSSSTVQNSLNYLINEAGYALPDLGGIAHQTVGGFISTGSSGGSTKYSIEDSIIGISIINGEGNEEELKRPDDKFFAAGVSMGLLGIITHITFKLEENYLVYGNQICTFTEPLNSDYQEGCPIDLFGSGTTDVPSLYDFLNNGDKYDAEYSRLYWWPQALVNRLTIWKAKRTKVKDLEGFDKAILTYNEFPEYFGSQIPAQIIANIAYIALNLLYLIDNEQTREIAAYILSFFNGVVCQSFQDIWYSGLPMDDKVSDVLLPTTFTELWFEIGNDDSMTKKVMNLLKTHFQNGGDKAVGNNATELYAAKANEFWLSPSYGYNVIRIDFLFFLGNIYPSDPETFYAQLWEVFNDVPFRCHWGKYIPDNYSDKVQSLYPKYNDWMNVRNQMDPKQ